MRKIARLAGVSVLIRLGPILVAALLGAAGCGADVVTQKEAKGAATTWTEQHADGWSIDIQSADPDEGFVQSPLVAPCTNNLLWLVSETKQGEINLFFDCPSSEVVDLAWIRAHFHDYSFGMLPIDIDAPGWQVTALAESTNLTSGLTFESWTGGVLSLRIESPLFQVGGFSESKYCRDQLGLDAPVSEDCYFDVPYTGPLALAMKVPLDARAFRVVGLRN